MWALSSIYHRSMVCNQLCFCLITSATFAEGAEHTKKTVTQNGEQMFYAPYENRVSLKSIFQIPVPCVIGRIL